MLLPVALLLSFLLIPPASRAADLQVYLFTGQSNSLGTTSSSEMLLSPGADPADASTLFFWSNVLSTNTVYPPLLYGTSGGLWTSLQTQQGDAAANPTFWGPEFGFARTMNQAGVSDVMVIKASRGGGPNTLWDESTFEANNDAGHMWGHLRDTVMAGLAQVGGGEPFQVKGFLYLQGESNSASDAAVADARLADLVANLKSLIESTYPGTTSGMYTVVAEIAASQSSAVFQTTTNQQRELAQGSGEVGFFGTSDLPLKADGIHFGGNEKLEIGYRFADAFNSQGWVEHPDLLGGYSADPGSLDAIPHPIAQGLAEAGNLAGVTMEALNDNGMAAWRIFDDSAASNPEYRQALVNDDFQAMFDTGWVFTTRAKVASGGGLALWSLTSANDPGWAVSSPRTINGFQLSRVNGDELTVTLWNNQSTVNLGAGSADMFHVLEMRGAAGSSFFDFYIDGQLEVAGLDLRDGVGLAGFDDIIVFNSGSTGGVGRDVYWNQVSLRAVPEPSLSLVLRMGALFCLFLTGL